jgi:hypothetical protein
VTVSSGAFGAGSSASVDVEVADARRRAGREQQSRQRGGAAQDQADEQEVARPHDFFPNGLPIKSTTEQGKRFKGIRSG